MKVNNMGNINTDIVVIDRFDYDELVAKANSTDEQIRELADKLHKEQNQVFLRVEFNKWMNPKGFDDVVGICHSGAKEDLWKYLDQSSEVIHAWARENLQQIGKEMREMNATKRDAIGYGKQIVNLREKIRLLKIQRTLAIGGGIIIAVVSLLFLA